MNHLPTVLLLAAALLAGCKATQEEKIKQQMTEAQHALTADERILAETNAKQFFDREFAVAKGEALTKVRGAWLECRPADSNSNGLVTCRGKVPKDGGGFEDVTRYCGYTPTLVGCSDVDMVRK
jgi:hypothetical protein